MKNNKQKGFTLIEILIVIGIIAILSAIVIVAINPARQFAKARNTQRTSNLVSILNAISQNSIDNKGIFTCSSAGPIPATSTAIKKGGYDIRSCLVPTYLSELPVDPSSGSLTETSYDTGYTIYQDATTGRINLNAPSAELSEAISISR